jgi:hypothetical protein
VNVQSREISTLSGFFEELSDENSVLDSFVSVLREAVEDKERELARALTDDASL